MEPKRQIAVLRCQVCKRELNRSRPVLPHERAGIMIGAVLHGVCPERHHNTLSDCNIGVDIEWIDADAS